MKSLVCGLWALCFCIVPVLAAEDAASEAPWAKADHVLKAALADLNTGGIRALRPHVGELEEALAEADKAFVTPEKGDIVVLTDGPVDTLIALAISAKAHPDRKTIAFADPYPAIAYYLGDYYNDIQRPDYALRVFERQRALEPNSHSALRPNLATERAIALAGLRRLPEALAAYEEGLTLPGLSDKDKARMMRGRGYILTEMERLDEAEVAYNDSLKLEPDSVVAKNELDYLRKLRLGGNKVQGGILAPDGKPIQK